MTRRQILGALAVAPLLPAAELPDELFERHDAAVDASLSRQILDPGARGYGNLETADGIFWAGPAAGFVNQAMAAHLHPKSKHYNSTLLVERMRLAMKAMEALQDTDGFIDLPVTNFSSPPDTGFAVHNLGTAACLAQRANRRDLVALLEPFLRKAGNGMAIGGVHTPNHRWVVSSALAQIHEVFPDSRYLKRIEQWLAEGIDIDSDGQFTERSTTVYNSVCDIAFVTLAEKLKRPALLDAPRKNLEAMMYLLHPDLEVVTEISRRQDRNERGDMGRYWFPLQYFAVRERNPVYAGLARHFAPKYASLATLMEYPELLGPMPAGAPPPQDFEKAFPQLGIARIRRGQRSATLIGNNSLLFNLRNRDTVITGVRMAGAFFGKGQLIPGDLKKVGASYQLTQSLEAGYYQPLDKPRPVHANEWGEVRTERRISQVSRITQTATITETPRGFRVTLASKGTPNVPVSIEIGLREGTKVEGAIAVGPGVYALPAGTATVGGNIRIGPGLGAHKYFQVRGAEAKLPGTSLYLTAFSPFEHTIEFECL